MDQTITFTDTLATSTDPITNASILFSGRGLAVNSRPVIGCTATAPPGVPVTGVGGLPSRIVDIGPI